MDRLPVTTTDALSCSSIACWTSGELSWLIHMVTPIWNEDLPPREGHLRRPLRHDAPLAYWWLCILDISTPLEAVREGLGSQLERMSLGGGNVVE